MADENKPRPQPITVPSPNGQGGQQPQGQQISVPLVSAGMTTHYSNFFRVTGTAEEVFLDFGLLSGVMNGNQPEAVNLDQRVVMSFPTAKRLLQYLAAAVGRHEQMFGPIEIDPQRRAKPQ